MPFYPGDDVVDWWGINPFSVEDLSHTTMLSFLNDAEQHQKPVMIGESTPRYVGVLQEEVSWNAWFKPYFELIHAHSGLKMFCYINFNWADFQQWSDWGDCRLEKNAVVAGHYNDELKATPYLHASGESAFRSRLGYNDTAATVTVQMPYEMQKLQNGDFESGLTNWNTDVWGGAAVFDVEQASPISGARSAHVKITQSSAQPGTSS